MPKLTAEIATARANLDHPGAMVVTVCCPLCGRSHVHGIPAGDLPDATEGYGHRTADCGGRGGYYVMDSAGHLAQ